MPIGAAGAKILVFGIFDEKDKHFDWFFCRNLLEFERKYSPPVPIVAAGATNFQKSTFLKQKNINFSRPGEGVITPFTPKVVPALSLGVLR